MTRKKNYLDIEQTHNVNNMRIFIHIVTDPRIKKNREDKKNKKRRYEI